VTAGVGWTAWRPLDEFGAISAAVLAETADGGQAFRWQREPTGVWRGQWSSHIVRLRHTDTAVMWSAPAGQAAETQVALGNYFRLHEDFDALTAALPWRTDAHLAACRAAFPGLRILRQPFGETLLGFLCSATKQIVQIKQMMALLAERHGAPLGVAIDGKPLHRLPTWEELASVPETQLRGCLLGFRARYIAATATFLAAHPGWLEETESLPYAAAKARLCALPGVGEKVADCVLLFGAGRLEAFPVDVWILRTLELRYGLTGWKPGPLAQFGRAHFGPLAGLAQQLLFAHERALARSAPAGK
jgi:N-glycosylase/DNA lyase